MSDEIKKFLIKLVAVVFAIILIINSTYNLIFADKLEAMLRIVNFKDNRKEISNKIREELKKALKKDNLLYEEDRILLKEIYQKLKNEFDIKK